ncbi:MAG: hypothetical protein ACAH17_01420 [Candidatus Paceibacterota bacterium]
MKATQIANGKEVVHVRPTRPPGYKTPKKSVRLEKVQRKRRSVPESPAPEVVLRKGRVEPIRTLGEVEKRKQKAGNLYHMKNH